MSWALYIFTVILSVLVLVVTYFIIKGLRRTWRESRKLPPPPESGSTWSNNAIRKQGKAGKGIR